MAIRQVREIGDDILTKQCKDVPRMTLRTKILIGDMLETMYEYHGVGLAAPQVGVLKRIVVIDVGEGPIVLINPEIVEIIRELTASGKPLFGWGLGHQLMAVSAGFAIEKLPVGHRGSNQPVRNLENGRIMTTEQNHGYAVSP